MLFILYVIKSFYCVCENNYYLTIQFWYKPSPFVRAIYLSLISTNSAAKSPCVLKKNYRETRLVVCGMSRERLEKARTTKTEKHALGKFNFKEAITLSSHGRFSTKQTHVTRLVSHRVYTGKHVVSGEEEEEKKLLSRTAGNVVFVLGLREWLSQVRRPALSADLQTEVDEIITRINAILVQEKIDDIF